MLLKNWDPTRGCYQVTFDLPAGLDVETAAVVGDFNGWSADSHVMERTSDGRLEVQIPFDPGTRARFRYRIDGDRWENDWNADEYVANEFGGEDSLLIVPAAPPSVEPPGTDGATRPSTKKAAAKKATAKKAPAKKATAKKAPVKKAPAEKAAAKKTAGEKKATAEKATAKRRTTAKKATAKKAAGQPAGGPPAEAP